MKIIILIPLLLILTSCGYKEVQQEYIESQKELIKLQMQEDKKPLVNIITPDGTKVTVRNPYKTNYKINKPEEHPVYKTAKSFFGLANSNLANIIGIGWAGRQIMEQATGDITGSYNSGSEISSNSGSGDFSLDRSTMTESNNTAQNDLVSGESTLDNSDNSDNSVNENWTDDNSDNSDNSENWTDDNSITNPTP